MAAMMEMTDVGSDTTSVTTTTTNMSEQAPPLQEDVLENGGVMNGGGEPNSLHDNVHSLPTVEELTGKSSRDGPRTNRGMGEDDEDYITAQNSNNTLYCFVCLFMLLIATSVGVGVGMSQRTSRDIGTEEYRHNERFRLVTSFLNNYSISGWDELLTDGSPQNMAANWIAHHDGMHLGVPRADPKTHKYALDFASRYILAVIYYTMGGHDGSWNEDLNFLSAQHHCNWFQIIVEEYAMFPRGVACTVDNTTSGENHLVMDALFLDNNGLVGTIPREMGMLTTLKILNLDLNEIRGGIPRSFFYMKDLKHLSIAHNILTGDMPGGLHVMHKLETIDLSYNFMAGHLPVLLSQMENLVALAVDNNGMSGDLNQVFGANAIRHNNLRWFHNVTGGALGNVKMQALYLEDNNFNTTLDESFLEGMTNLKRLDISDNKLNGSLPKSLFSVLGASLEVLDLHNNLLTGEIPDIPALTGGASYELQYLALQQNKFNGAVPTTINRLTKLQHLDLAENQLTSAMPDFNGLTELTYLFLAQNNFVQGMIPLSYAGLTNLQELSLKSTKRTGTIPTEVFHANGLSKLILLDLDNNELVGSIPRTIGDLRNIQFLLLNDNQLTGTVPSPEFENLYNLRLLFLDQNSLTGSLDQTICNKPPNSFMPYIISDCGDHSTIPATDVEIQCDCCFKCCSNDRPCNDNDFIPSNDPMWQFGYQRVFYVFGDRTAWFAAPSLPGQ